MSTKLVRYKDVCVALVPMIADMLQKGDVKPAIDTLNALGALEDAEDVDLAKEIKGTDKDVFLLRDGKKIPYNEVE